MYKLLIVEDDAGIAAAIKAQAEAWAMSCRVIEDFRSVMQEFAAFQPHLVLMDITMPNKTGIEALKDIKGMDPMAKVVMCSAMGQEAMVVEAIKLGALDFIVKPFKPDRILQTVKKVLG